MERLPTLAGSVSSERAEREAVQGHGLHSLQSAEQPGKTKLHLGRGHQVENDITRGEDSIPLCIKDFRPRVGGLRPQILRQLRDIGVAPGLPRCQRIT